MLKYCKPAVIRFYAKVMLLVLSIQLLVPATKVFALTSGPTQPEVQSFEPVGTTDMVDLFTGDFVYNIPLLDVEGYPVNIAYHSDPNMEQEASWVGLGWNINPGEINRNVRGIPDDFDGQRIEKKLHINEERNYRLDLGVGFDYELLGALNLGLSLGAYMNYNNYRGMGVGTSVGLGLSVPVINTGLGVSASISSMDGADVDAYANMSFVTSKTERGNAGSISFSGSTGFNTRTGLKNIGLGLSATYVTPNREAGYKSNISSYTIPIGLQNYVAVVTNASTLNALAVQVKLGAEVFYGYPAMNLGASISKLSYQPDGSKYAYGYLYAQDANDASIMDFSREKDGVYNATLPNLPLSGMDYDIYSISGQGTGGMFRPFRNDIGTVYDPETSNTTNSADATFEFGTPIGPVGGLFEFGTDVTIYNNTVESGPWFTRRFKGKQDEKMYEPVYFKQAGELTYNPVQKHPAIAGHEPVYLAENGNLYKGIGVSVGAPPSLYSGENNRAPRANYINYTTNEEAIINDVVTRKTVESYPKQGFYDNNSSIKYRPRIGGTYVNRMQKKQIAQFTQTLPDGRRYIYGQPAVNNIQKEVTFSVQAPAGDNVNGQIHYSAGDDGLDNDKNREHYYQGVTTPAYAHSYLLTEVLSSDYADVTGDGPSEDDPGSYTKFNYTMVDSDYRWRAPYSASPSERNAQYIPGFASDKQDDKAQYIIGSKELWYLHSIETKNFVAEFYISARKDGKGATDAINASHTQSFLHNTITASNSYKLDSIKLYNKYDRYVNKANATPIKTVIFQYDYSLCTGTPNSQSNGGKLTLKRIYLRYGKSQKSLLSPYVFNYSSQNPAYNFANKDRWGNYKPAPGANDPTNYDFPYVKQDAGTAAANASDWQLTQVNLPSGGVLHISYEPDDYSYVQDKRTMEMFMVAGVGQSANYEPKDVLYEDVDNAYDYIYFKRSISREEAGKTMKENYLQNSDDLYFSFNLDIAGKNKYENIKGYAKAEAIDVCPNNNQYGYIKVKREKAGGKSDKLINPVTLCGLNIGRYYLPQIIYPGYRDDDAGASSILMGLVASSKELFSIWQNANVRFIKQGLSKKFRPARSWIRLNTPGYTKIGGGNRVKTLSLDNVWDEMASNGTEASYGRTYDYTLDDPQRPGISSGVANYEPLIGGDENPLHRPVQYTADAGRLLPAIEFYQEEPFGESFYPSPVVGYSRVTVRSIHQEVSASSQAEDVYEFYTAKDFPYETTFTPKATRMSEKSKSLTKQTDKLAVAQGYTLILNDMHGKAKSVSNYVLKGDNKELITSVKYNYQTDDKGKLYNKVKALVRNNDDIGNYNSFGIADVVLGEDVDFTVDSRKRNMESTTTSIHFNLNVVNFLFVTIPIPTVFFPDKVQQNFFATTVSTKTIQQYGILKSIESVDHGARNITENLLYDSETGQVILSRTNNEYKDPVSSLNYPAYWANENMGPAYYNVGYEETADTLYVDGEGYGYLFNLSNKKYYKTGDELLVTCKEGNEVKNYRLWVTGNSNVTVPVDSTVTTHYRGYPPGADCSDYCCNSLTPTQYDDTGCYRSVQYTYDTQYCALRVVPRAIYPGGNDSLSWRPFKSISSNVHIKILRSGKRNNLDKAAQQLTLAGNLSVSTFNDLFGSQLANKVLNTSAVHFANYNDPSQAVITEYNYRYNNYVKGLVGFYKEQQYYGYLADRAYSALHSRKDGVITNYCSPWSFAQGQGGSSGCISDNDFIYWSSNVCSNWKLLKQSIYNAYGMPAQETDAAYINSSVIYGYNNNLPVAVAQGATYKQMVYYNFEDLAALYNTNIYRLGIQTTVPTSQLATMQVNTYGSNGKYYYTLPGNAFGANKTIVKNIAHTGLYSMKVTAIGDLYLGNLASFAQPQYYYISMWVKSTGSAVPNANQFLLKTVNGSSSATYTAFKVTTPSIDGWYKLEGKIDLPSATGNLYIRVPAAFYVDDVRFCPDDANMKSYAYNPFNLRLMAALDENNFATFYEYDQEGALVRVKKETDKGILTVNENRKSVRKQ